MSDHKELRKSVQEQTYSYPEHVTALLTDFNRVKAERDRLIENCVYPVGKDNWFTVAGPQLFPTRDAAIEALLKGSE